MWILCSYWHGCRKMLIWRRAFQICYQTYKFQCHSKLEGFYLYVGPLFMVEVAQSPVDYEMVGYIKKKGSLEKSQNGVFKRSVKGP
jgi:hypothetical protein